MKSSFSRCGRITSRTLAVRAKSPGEGEGEATVFLGRFRLGGGRRMAMLPPQ
jgi:hypothetical protein